MSYPIAFTGVFSRLYLNCGHIYDRPVNVGLYVNFVFFPLSFPLCLFSFFNFLFNSPWGFFVCLFVCLFVCFLLFCFVFGLFVGFVFLGGSAHLHLNLTS